MMMKHLPSFCVAVWATAATGVAMAQAVAPVVTSAVPLPVTATDFVARDAAATAQTTANQAQNSANQALGEASNAQLSAQRAQTDATKALNGEAHDRIARNLANHAQTTADNAQVTANGAQSTANAAQASATQAHQRIDDLDRKASRGIASALATTAAMPAGTDLQPGETAMNIGFGSYGNHGAVALGFARRIKTEQPSVANGAVVRGAVAISSGRPAVSVGMGWKW